MNPSVLVLTYNEETHLRTCLESLRWASEIFVLDSGSQDSTVEVAKQLTPHVFFRPFDDFGTQRNWALRNLPFGSEWLLVVDADEIVPPALAEEMLALKPGDGEEIVAYQMRFRVYFEGVWIRRSSLYPTWITRLFKHKCVEYEPREVNAHPRVQGRTGRLRNDLIHWNKKGLREFLAKHNEYTSFEAREYLRDRRRGVRLSPSRMFWGSWEERRREMKRLAMRLPGRPLLKFLYAYVARGGVLDGRAGFHYCLLLGINEFFVSLKLRELTRSKEDARSEPVTKAEIQRYWGTHPNAISKGGGFSPGSRAFFEAVASHRYTAEPCIPEVAEFKLWAGRRVLEVGCGMGTDLREFARWGATVVGVDLTSSGVELARRGFEVFGLLGVFAVADVERLPFRDGVFDLVYSHGVIHHTPGTEAAVREIHRVVRPGGEARVMVYHRNSYFARVIVGMLVGPAMRAFLWAFRGGEIPGGVERVLPRRLKDMYPILAEHGYSRERVLALSTDPSSPGDGNANPLSRCYSRMEAKNLFASFSSCETNVRQLYYAGFIPAGFRRWLEQRIGWFLFIRAVK